MHHREDPLQRAVFGRPNGVPNVTAVVGIGKYTHSSSGLSAIHSQFICADSCFILLTHFCIVSVCILLTHFSIVLVSVLLTHFSIVLVSVLLNHFPIVLVSVLLTHFPIVLVSVLLTHFSIVLVSVLLTHFSIVLVSVLLTHFSNKDFCVFSCGPLLLVAYFTKPSIFASIYIR
jgi:hypothetical protein